MRFTTKKHLLQNLISISTSLSKQPESLLVFRVVFNRGRTIAKPFRASKEFFDYF